jgi:hypothetical protein
MFGRWQRLSRYVLYFVLIGGGIGMWFTHYLNQGQTNAIALGLVVGGIGTLLTDFLAYLQFKKKGRLAAQNIRKNAKILYSSEDHQFRLVSPDEFPTLDHDFYNQYRTWLESREFQFVGDGENVTVSQALPNMRTFVRCLIGDNGTICCGLRHVKTGSFPMDKKIVGFETELSDGTFLITNNLGNHRIETFPGIDLKQMPFATHPDTQLQTHRDRVAAALDVRSGVTPTILRTMDDIIQIHHKRHAIIAKHIQARGYIGAADVERHYGHNLNPHDQAIVSELEKLKATDQ